MFLYPNHRFVRENFKYFKEQYIVLCAQTVYLQGPFLLEIHPPVVSVYYLVLKNISCVSFDILFTNNIFNYILT